MNRRLVVVAFVALLVLLGVLLVWRTSRATPEGITEPTITPTTPAAPAEAATVELVLYFPNGDGLLEAESRTVALAATAVDNEVARAEAGARALLEGPRNASLFAPFPAEVTLDRVLLNPRGLLYVNLLGPPTPPAAGSLIETLRIWSVVNTVLDAAPSARGVSLTWNGAQLESLGGHIDTGRPLLARPDLVADPQ
jgi:hypothetical protein